MLLSCDAQHTGNLGNSGPSELTDIKWKFKTGKWIALSPAIANGVVFFGSEDGYLYALE